MYEDGFQNITNVDISFTVVKQMQEMYKEKCPSLTCTSLPLTCNRQTNGC